MPASQSHARPTTIVAGARRINARRASASVMSTINVVVEDTTTMTNSTSSPAITKRKRANASDSDDEYEPDHAEDSDADSSHITAPGDGSRCKSKRHMTTSSTEITVSTVPAPTDVLGPTVITLQVGTENLRRFITARSNVLDPTDVLGHTVTTLKVGTENLRRFVAARSKVTAQLPPMTKRSNRKLPFAFGWTPFPKQNLPSKALTKQIIHVMDEDLRNNHGINARHDQTDSPIVLDEHGKAQIDTLVRVIMSQATNNRTAQKVASQLCLDYDYEVNGQFVEGKIPNYHKMLGVSVEQLQESIRHGGIFKRAPYIKKLLEKVSEINIGLCKERGDAVITGNEKDASDFVPGMLSLDFLENKNKDELFTWYTELEGIGHKTALCMMAFAHDLPVCAVDIHVHRMLIRIEWVPPTCNELQATMQIDAILDDADKQFFHQLCWHHGQKCLDCKATGPSQAARKAGYRPCVIEQYLNRNITIKSCHTPTKKPGVINKAVNKGQKKGKSDVIPEAEMDAEVALPLGYILKTISIDDNFDRPGANRSEERVWMKPSSWAMEAQAARLKLAMDVTMTG